MGGLDCAGDYRGYQEAQMYRKCGREEGENTTPSSKLIDILRLVLISINIEAMMAESAIYRGREMLSKMVD